MEIVGVDLASSSHFGKPAIVFPVVVVREGVPSTSLLVRAAKSRGWWAFAYHNEEGDHGREHQNENGCDLAAPLADADFAAIKTGMTAQ